MYDALLNLYKCRYTFLFILFSPLRNDNIIMESLEPFLHNLGQLTQLVSCRFTGFPLSVIASCLTLFRTLFYVSRQDGSSLGNGDKSFVFPPF